MVTLKENLFNHIPNDLENEVFEEIIKSKKIKIERIISKGHSSPESAWYEQEKNEFVIVLKGAGILAFENEEEVQLQIGDYINIPAMKKHKVIWTDDQTETIWLAVHY